VSIVADSAASLPASVLIDPKLHVVPMTLTINDQEFIDGVDISVADFYALLKQSPGGATTSAPSPAAFVRGFEAAARESDSILCIVVAAHFSATADSARTASEQFLLTHPDANIPILDAQSAAGGDGLSARGARQQAPPLR
jgi:DegV family protein with EDD domain